ncbi:MAG: flagellar export chaperone FliS [Spongiibacteraceae bacterium]|jgi:flagellar protein FliS|nr:flagellar export chaperone FliS [Spongiibacteraceae bacterium]
MSDFSGYDAYRHTTVEARAATADPHQLVLMLVDGLLEELARAAGHMEAKRYDRKGQSISKCMDILSGLDTALDLEKGGEIAAQLRELYDFCGRQLFEASVNNDPGMLAVVEQVITNLREGWQALAA